MTQHNVQIQNYQNLTYIHKRGSSTIDSLQDYLQAVSVI